MSLLPEDAHFEEIVVDYFSVYKGSGFALSALDVDLLTEWARLSIPAEVITRGIRKAAEAAMWHAAPGEPVLRTLRGCRRQVEAEIKKFHTLNAGKSPPSTEPLTLRRHEKLRDALQKVKRQHPMLNNAIDRLLANGLQQPPQSLAASGRHEELAYAVILRGLSFGERLSILQRARVVRRQCDTIENGTANGPPISSSGNHKKNARITELLVGLFHRPTKLGRFGRGSGVGNIRGE